MGKTIGIDLGTTNSCVAVMEGGQARVIPNAEGSNTTPSVVGYNRKTLERLVGAAAKRQAVEQPLNTIFSIKRFMGLPFEDSEKEQRLVPYKVKRSKTGACSIEVLDKHLSPEEISAMVLTKMKETAEAFLGERVTEAVITVPAYFNDAQRQATKDAGAIAGLEVKRIINEPTAAALAYGFDKKKEGTIAVFDFGGGTFDVSILELSDGAVEVKSTNGDTHLGGDNVDQAIIDWLLEEFRKKEGIDLRPQADAMSRLRDAAEKAKCELSNLTLTEIRLPYITVDSSGPKHLEETLSRAKFEMMIQPILEKLKEPCQTALNDANLRASQINEVLLVGGSTRIPKVQELVRGLFGKEPNKGVNPDEVVALGAAVQGGVLTGDVMGVLLLDVTPLSLGTRVVSGEMSFIIPRNTTIPTRRSSIYTTVEDNQTSIAFPVYQGERLMAEDNKLLGEFELNGIRPAQREVPQIEVTFDIDTNGILNAKAVDKETGKEAHISITGSTGLSKADLDAKIREAERYKAEDEKRAGLAKDKNVLDQAIYQLEKLIKQNGDRLSRSDRNNAEQVMEMGKDALRGLDGYKIKKSIEDLNNISQRLA